MLATFAAIDVRPSVKAIGHGAVMVHGYRFIATTCARALTSPMDGSPQVVRFDAITLWPRREAGGWPKGAFRASCNGAANVGKIHGGDGAGVGKR